MRKLALVALAIALVTGVEATFASSVGFSGRNADCSVCHSMDGAPAATASLTGVPAEWMPGEAYQVEAAVAGGPAAILPGRPQGGFELEAEAGEVTPGPNMDELMRTPREGVITYEPEGTFQRSWPIIWTTPQYVEPVPITLWLAVVSANGNHDPELNISDGGERGDAVATTQVTIEPSPSAVAAWRALPLLAPAITSKEQTDGRWLVHGTHQDDNATHVRVLRGSEELVHASQTNWTLEIAGDIAGVQIRSEGAGRQSPAVALANDEPAPALGLVGVLVMLAAIAARRPR